MKDTTKYSIFNVQNSNIANSDMNQLINWRRFGKKNISRLMSYEMNENVVGRINERKEIELEKNNLCILGVLISFSFFFFWGGGGVFFFFFFFGGGGVFYYFKF